ncbi:MAG: protein-glutamate O-methyltransferase CheR [Treponema sp.]|nr:protein-glutamate O-methyltransferase CheR [Treponema sp.]
MAAANLSFNINALQNNTLVLTEAQFNKIANFIEENVGIKMPHSKKLMMQARLSSRLKAKGFSSFDEYINYVFANHSAAQDEMVMMIDALTTNLTHFFRESPHFDYMTSTVLPNLLEMGITRPELWSAGCSSGEEPYTLSMVMQEYMRAHKASFADYHILATDISTRVLEKAMNAVYPMDSVSKMSFDMKKRYFLKSRNPETPLVRIKEAVRNKVSFQRLNFMDEKYSVNSKKHIIFCRNVLIYFDKPTQEAVVSRLVEQLVPDGYLFLGHSETIFGMNLPLRTVAPTVFRKQS